jgi:hypothetical protein
MLRISPLQNEIDVKHGQIACSPEGCLFETVAALIYPHRRREQSVSAVIELRKQEAPSLT